MPRKLGTLKEELMRLEGPELTEWVSRIRTRPDNKRLQFFALTGEKDVSEAEGVMRRMLKIFNPHFVTKDESLNKGEKDKALKCYHLLNSVYSNFKNLGVDYASETQLLEEEKRRPEHGAEYKRAMDAARGVGGDVGPAGAGSSGVSVGAGSSGVDKVRVVNLIPRPLKPATIFAKPAGAGLASEDRVKSELERLEALNQSSLKGGNRISPFQLEELMKYDRYKEISNNIEESKAIPADDYKWLQGYLRDLGGAKVRSS